MPINKGIGIFCNLKGEVLDLAYDGLNMANFIITGKFFVNLVDRGSHQKAEDFLKTIKADKAAFDWQINLLTRKDIEVLHFSGFLLDDKILIIGAKSRDEMADITDLIKNMPQISDKQSKQLIRIKNDLKMHLKEQECKDSELYDEIGRLNNELTDAYRELTKKNIQLDKLNQEKNNFLGMAAHDLRNPLSIILMYSDFLIEEASEELDEEQMEFLQVIQTSSEFMLKLINDLLDVSKIESGKLELEKEPTDLLELIDHNITLNRVMAHKKDIIIDFNYQKDFKTKINIDKAKIEQVLNNLISNAVKFSQPGKKVMVNLTKSGKEITVSVKDQGQGIKEDELPKLFKPFSKTSAKGTAGEKSTGLGLSISKRIIEEHGGIIGVDSEYGKGSTFYFTLKK